MQAKKRIISYIGFPLFLITIIAVTIIFWDDGLVLFTDQKALSAFLQENESTIALYYSGAQIIQVVLFFIPGEFVQIAGGFLFPFWQALLLTSISICAGGFINYLLGRSLGRSFFRSLFGEKSFDAYTAYFTSENAWTICAILFLIPGFPKDVLCYIAGIVSLKGGKFLLIASIARLPGVIGTIFMGRAVFDGNWILFGVLGALSIIIVMVVHRYRAALTNVFRGMTKK